jgi:hypothetical protein
MPTPLDNEVLVMNGWPAGVNNRVRETEAQAATRSQFEIPSSEWLRSAVNVDLTQLGHPLRRDGYSLVDTGFTHSLWSSTRLTFGLCVKAGWLTHINMYGDQTSLVEVHPYLPVSYADVNGEVYWSNTAELGRVRYDFATHWGVDVAPVPVVATVAGGSLFDGTYQVAVTCKDSSGTEHGASEPVTIDVVGGQNLVVTFGVPPANAAYWNVYCTQANGEILYQTASVSVGTPNVAITQPDLGKGKHLETLDRHPPKPGSIVRYMSGRIYIARQDTVLFTDPLRYHLTQPSQGMFMFDDTVTLLEPTTDGLYVGGAFGVVFIQGTDPYNVTQRAVASYAPVSRASLRMAGERLGVSVDEVPLWWGKDGVMYAGLPSGELRPLTRDRLAVPSHELGAMLLREREGMSHVVSVLRRGSETNLMAATDSVVAEVRRNCVKLN